MTTGAPPTDEWAPDSPIRRLEVVIPTDAITLAGTLTLPGAAASAPMPAVLLLPGSGPVDRDSNVRSMRFDVTRHLAEALAASGVASLRYDKRGVGASGGGDWRTAGLWDLVHDAESALAFLASRPEVDARRIVVLGHSEGALVATWLAAHDASVSGVVLLAGSARSGHELLMWQARALGPTLPRPVHAVLRLLRIDLEKRAAATHQRLAETTTDVARIGGARMNARWFREFLAYDPRPDLAEIRVPVLAITGGKDLQVDPDDLGVIAALVQGDVTVIRPPDVTHTLRRQPGAPSLKRYRRELRRPMDGEVTDAIVAWVVGARTGAEPRRG